MPPRQATWTTATIATILALHACPARCKARRRCRTAKLRSAPCLALNRRTLSRAARSGASRTPPAPVLTALSDAAADPLRHNVPAAIMRHQRGRGHRRRGLYTGLSATINHSRRAYPYRPPLICWAICRWCCSTGRYFCANAFSAGSCPELASFWKSATSC